MADLSVNIGDLKLCNPVMTASGTFGYGKEFEDFVDLEKIGGIIVKGTTLHHREGNPYPRMAETPMGMLNAVGLQNKGVDYFVEHIYPQIRDIHTNMIVNVSGSAVEDYVKTAEIINDLDHIPAIELNISCPNVKQGGMAFGVSACGCSEVVKAVRNVYKKTLIVKLSPNVTDITEIARAAEASGADFDQLAAKASDTWNKALSVIDAKGSDDQLAMLYTSLYHTMINPCVYTDVDGQYRGLDHNIHQADGFTNYTVFSVWDTYRALHPLFNIINRQVNTDIAKSMLKHCEQSVHHALPIWSHMANENWCMIGYHSVSVLADAIAKGLPIDKDAALKAMINSSTIPYYEGTKEFMELGYVPLDRNGSAGSLTLEYAYDDWTIYNTALLVGNRSVADTYKKRASNYANVFDTSIGYARPRYTNGKFKEDFSLLSTHGEGFIEGNALNYSFYVPQDVNGMIQLMGGEQAFITKMDSLFTMHLPDEFFAETEDVTKEGLLGGYVHGNEPSHHIPFLYAWTSQPWKTQFWQREIMNKMYRNNIDGLCGNDDCGQMSAWYILSAMGFYPVCPGTDQYVLGAPYLPYMKVRLENGKTFEVKADKVSDKNRYVKAVKLNGKPYTKGYITQDDIMNGGTLTFEMTSSPNKKRLFNGEDRPYSLTD